MSECIPVEHLLEVGRKGHADGEHLDRFLAAAGAPVHHPPGAGAAQHTPAARDTKLPGLNGQLIQ